MKLLCPSKADF